MSTSFRDVLVSGNRIAGIDSKATAGQAEAVIRGDGHHSVIPGLINAHFRSSANRMKGSIRSLTLELFMLYESPSGPAFTPASEIIDAVMRAHHGFGMRVRVALEAPGSLWKGGAAVLRLRDERGVLKAGALADLVLVTPHATACTPLNDRKGRIVNRDPSTSIRMTTRDGRSWFHDGEVTTVHASARRERALTVFSATVPAVRADRRAAERSFARCEWTAHRAAHADVGMSRRGGAR